MTIEKVEYNLRGKVKRITALQPEYEEIYQESVDEKGHLIKRSIKVKDDESVAIGEILSLFGGVEIEVPEISILTRYELNNHSIEKRRFRGRIRKTLFRYTDNRKESPAKI